jgi:hypothetical protein
MRTFKMLLVWSLGTMVLTLLHHAYGAIIYNDPFRLHVALLPCLLLS